MAKKNINLLVMFFNVNVFIFLGLISIIVYLSYPIIEGVTDMNCCGGIQPGVHYREVDTEPPEYISRCFKSTHDDSGTNYQWSGFPCTSGSSSDCCSDGGSCIASSRGGYCERSGSNYIYNRGESTKRSYLKRRNDSIIDVHNINDMKDYFYNRGERSESRDNIGLSSEMRQFMARKDDNQKYMLEQQREKVRLQGADRKSAKDKILDQNKNHQLLYTVTWVHLIMLVSIAIAIREPIIDRIQSFLDILSIQDMKFSGKNIKDSSP